VLELGWRRKRRKGMGRFLWFRVVLVDTGVERFMKLRLLLAKLVLLELVIYYTHFHRLEPTGTN
jgi:hypothetical protein